jgi:nitroreductase
MEVFEAIKIRKSIRIYKTTPVDDRTLEQLLEAGD